MAQSTAPVSQRRKASASTHQRASDRMREADGMDLNLPMIGHVRVPRADHLAFYGGLAALAALQLLEWPVALVFGVGHALAENSHSRSMRQLGDAFQDA